MNPEPLMLLEEAADYLRLHPVTLRRYAATGQVPAIKLGKVWRFHRVALDALAAPTARATEATAGTDGVRSIAFKPLTTNRQKPTASSAGVLAMLAEAKRKGKA